MTEGRRAPKPNLAPMRRLLLLAPIATLAWAPSAFAAPPVVSVKATPTFGAAPLAVKLTASGDPAGYRWAFGDGTAGTGASVVHTYRKPGRYKAVVTATAQGEKSRAAVKVTAYKVSLRANSPVSYGQPVLFRGRLRPGDRGARVTLVHNGRAVALAHVHPGGAFRIRTRVTSPGPYQAVSRHARSNVFSVTVRPVLVAKVTGSGVVGTRLAVLARLRPRTAGTVRVRVFRHGKQIRSVLRESPATLRLRTRRPQDYTVRLQVVPRAGFAGARELLRVSVYLPRLGLGSRGPSVRFLQERLRELHYALRGVTGRYGYDTYEAVLAFQKVHWLPRTGRVTARLWRILRRASIPLPRYGHGTHFEVDKSRQVVFDVRGGRVARVIHASTGATGNTPVGVWHVHSKTPGYNAKGMYYSLYFLRGFAIYGYADVPSYPASHGCVRVPLWIAPTLYATHPYGTTVYIY
jgi:PKD domain/Putative peptidoglycan binding domain/L,D-transpeptidase catalytic domain